MAEIAFNTPEGQTIARELLIAYLDTGTGSAPVLSAIGKRVEDSSEDMDWGKETVRDVIGNTWTTMEKPVVTQSFDPIPLDAGDAAAVKMWNLGVRDQDAQALANQKMVIAHFYVGNANANFAEHYSGCAIEITKLGGSGGGNLEISTEITYGGERTLGTVKKDTDGKIVFTPGAAAD